VNKNKYIKNIFRFMFINNQQMHSFLAVYYFILSLLHVSTLTCHHKELFRSCRIICESNAVVDKTLRCALLCVYYVDAWCVPIGAYQAFTTNIGKGQGIGKATLDRPGEVLRVPGV
jgi:hypothetical protein